MKKILIILGLLVLAGCSDESGTKNEAIGPLVVEENFDATTSPGFERHICVMEFTGQWCGNCPRGYEVLDLAVNGTSAYPSKYEGVAHIMALHDNAGGADEFAEPLQTVQLEILRNYGLDAYPSALVDLTTAVILPDGNINAALKKSSDEPATCDVAVTSTNNNGTIQVKVKLASLQKDSYRVALFVVEDEIVAPQSMGGLYDPEYVHHHVARKMLSSGYKGDTMGELEAGMQVSRTYTFTADPEWKLENTEIYALAINGREQINNVAVCAIDGGKQDYKYIQE